MLELSLYGGDSGDTSALSGQVTLTFDQRSRSRLRCQLDDGREAGIYVDRGLVLHDGQLLQDSSNQLYGIKSADEPVSAVYVDDVLLMSKLCYHLGNRHVTLEVGRGRIAYKPDYVLDDMVKGLGAQAVQEQAPFHPESGAYGHHHSHD